MLEAIKKFFKDDYLVKQSFPWAVNLTTLFGCTFVFIVPLFIQDQAIREIFPWVSLVTWITYYSLLRKKLLKKLNG